MTARAEPSAEVALLMTDIVGSTSLYQRVGDEAARRDVAKCLSRFSEVVEHGGGRVVKSLGDGLLCVFPAATEAFEVAAAMLDEAQLLPLDVRTGVHAGPVVTASDGDVFGDAVNTVARLAAAAAPGEVLLSDAVQSKLDERRCLRLRTLPPLALRGRRGRLPVFGLQRSSSLGATDMATQMLSSSGTVAEGGGRVLALRHAGGELRLQPGESVVLGRGLDCDILLDGPRASRRHARIQEIGGNLQLEDFSSNGTWIVVEGLPPMRLHRDRVPLIGRGLIHCGAAPGEDSGTPIRFEQQSDG